MEFASEHFVFENFNDILSYLSIFAMSMPPILLAVSVVRGSGGVMYVYW